MRVVFTLQPSIRPRQLLTLSLSVWTGCEPEDTSADAHVSQALAEAARLSSSTTSSSIRAARCRRSKVSPSPTRSRHLTSERPRESYQSAGRSVRLSGFSSKNEHVCRQAGRPVARLRGRGRARHSQHPPRIRQTLFLPRNRGFPGQTLLKGQRQVCHKPEGQASAALCDVTNRWLLAENASEGTFA